MKLAIQAMCIVILLNSWSFAVHSETSNVDQKLLNDAFITSINPYVYQAVKEFYGDTRSYDLWDAKVLEIKQVNGWFDYIVKIQINTFVGPHNPPLAVDTLTIHLTPTRGKVIGYDHVEKN